MISHDLINRFVVKNSSCVQFETLRKVTGDQPFLVDTRSLYSVLVDSQKSQVCIQQTQIQMIEMMYHMKSTLQTLVASVADLNKQVARQGRMITYLGSGRVGGVGEFEAAVGGEGGENADGSGPESAGVVPGSIALLPSTLKDVYVTITPYDFDPSPRRPCIYCVFQMSTW